MSLWRDTLLKTVAPRVARAYLLLLRATMRIERESDETLARVRRESGQYILAFWHSRFAMMPFLYPGGRMVGLLSQHRDSRMLAWVLESFSFEVAYGSSTAGGTRAVRELLQRVRAGYDVGLAPDGPRGPRRRVKPGVIAIARLSGLPIVPVTYSARPARRLGSWDRTLFPWPFARALFLCGSLIHVPRHADEAEQERLRLVVEREIDRITELADARVGLAPEPAPPVEA